MHPLYTESEFKTAKSRDLLTLSCVLCNNTFLKKKHEVMKAIKGHPSVKCKYCSPACSHEARRTSVITQCTNCSKSISTKPSEIKGSSFCSQSCSAKYNNKHKRYGVRRSKMEAFIEEKLTKDFPKIQIEFNKADIINYELDIFIPSLSLAIEINGIHHYQPIYGLKKFCSVQSNDRKKKDICREMDIQLHVIDISQLKNFSSKAALPFYCQVKDLVTSKLEGAA